MVPQYGVALADFAEGTANWQMWGRLGWLEIKRRYRRTVIGPFWTTLSLGIFMFVLGLVWAQLMHQNPKVYLPFLSAGLLAWNLVSAIMSEGCVTFVEGENLIKQLRFPYTILACSVAWRNVIVFLHNLAIFVVVAVYAGVRVRWPMLLAVPALILIWVNGVWAATLLGMIVARYRDVRQVMMSLLQILLFVTPVFWSPDQVGRRFGQWFVTPNLLFHYVDILRSPLLGRAPAVLTWEMVLLSTIAGWAITFWTYSRFRRRLAYWL